MAGRDIVQLWTLEMAKSAVETSSLGRAHSAGDNLKTARVSDRLWIVANEHGQLRLVGHFVITVADLTQRQAAKLLGVPSSRLFGSKWHVLGDSPREALGSLVDIHSLAKRLRFESKRAPRLKLKNGRLDPQTLRNLRVLRPESAAYLRGVWEKASASRQTNRQSKAGRATPDIVDDEHPDITQAAEGRLLTSVHERRERNSKLVRAKKASVYRQKGNLSCEACGFDFLAVFGERGDGFIECHHTRPIASLTDGSKTRLSDLALLCSNCHRMIHVKQPWLSLSELRTLIRAQER